MKKIPLKKKFFPDNYWIRYVDTDGETKTVSLSACANSFKLVTQGQYASDDGLKCVGWRYEENGELCFELFTAGHVVFTESLYPSLKDTIACLFQGLETDEYRRYNAMEFERALNQGGWKTVYREQNL